MTGVWIRTIGGGHRAHNIHAWPARQIQAKLKVRNSLEKTLLMASNTAQEEK